MASPVTGGAVEEGTLPPSSPPGGGMHTPLRPSVRSGDGASVRGGSRDEGKVTELEAAVTKLEKQIKGMERQRLDDRAGWLINLQWLLWAVSMVRIPFSPDPLTF